MEAYPSADNSLAPARNGGKGTGKYIACNDMDLAEVRDCLWQEAVAGYYAYTHFGIPCTGWASMNQVNGGTRTLDRPEGCDPVPMTPYKERARAREKKANRQAEYIAEFCIMCHQHGIFFSIENPVPSHLWLCKSFQRLKRVLGKDFYEVTFHQCAFGLTLPGCAPNEYCRKTTRFWSNMPEIMRLERRCPGQSPQHIHVHAIGNVTVDGKRLSRAGAAGRYPIDLCQTIAIGARDALCRSTWQGPCPWRPRD